MTRVTGTVVAVSALLVLALGPACASTRMSPRRRAAAGLECDTPPLPPRCRVGPKIVKGIADGIPDVSAEYYFGRIDDPSSLYWEGELRRRSGKRRDFAIAYAAYRAFLEGTADKGEGDESRIRARRALDELARKVAFVAVVNVARAPISIDRGPPMTRDGVIVVDTEVHHYLVGIDGDCPPFGDGIRLDRGERVTIDLGTVAPATSPLPPGALDPWPPERVSALPSPAPPSPGAARSVACGDATCAGGTYCVAELRKTAMLVPLSWSYGCRPLPAACLQRPTCECLALFAAPSPSSEAANAGSCSLEDHGTRLTVRVGPP